MFKKSVRALLFAVSLITSSNASAASTNMPVTMLDGGNCGFSLASVLHIGKGETLGLTHDVMTDGRLRLILVRIGADGKHQAYSLLTSPKGLEQYLDGIYAAEPAKYTFLPMFPVQPPAIRTKRALRIEQVQKILSGGRLRKDHGLFKFGGTYFSSNPIMSNELPDALQEFVNDACAYETKVVADREKQGPAGEKVLVLSKKQLPAPAVGAYMQLRSVPNANLTLMRSSSRF